MFAKRDTKDYFIWIIRFFIDQRTRSILITYKLWSNSISMFRKFLKKDFAVDGGSFFKAGRECARINLANTVRHSSIRPGWSIRNREIRPAAKKELNPNWRIISLVNPGPRSQQRFVRRKPLKHRPGIRISRGFKYFEMASRRSTRTEWNEYGRNDDKRFSSAYSLFFPWLYSVFSCLLPRHRSSV